MIFSFDGAFFAGMGAIIDVLWTGGFVLVVLYSGFLIFFSGRNSKACKLQQNWSLPVEIPKVSVLIAFRNEERNLIGLLESLKFQDYSSEFLEFILVNDHSTDNGFMVVEDWIKAQNDSNFILFNLPESKAGKKQAIAFGAEKATGAFILTTDADCILHPHWIAEMVIVQTRTDAEMVCGQVHIHPGKWWQHAEAVELGSLVAVAASGINFGKPNFCNAANLLISRSEFLNAQSERTDHNLASGDDVFLLHHLHNQGKKIAFCQIPLSGVKSGPHLSWKSFENQRIRWASKWKSGIAGSNQWLAAAVWLFHLMVILMVASLFFLGHWQTALVFLVLKSTSETIFIEPFVEKNGFQNNSQPVWLMQIPYSLYVLYFGIRVLFSRNYFWKGRKISY